MHGNRNHHFDGCIRHRCGRLFLAAMIAGAINLLLSQNHNVPSFLEDLVIVAFGGLLVAAGVMILRRR
jgi:hypothetical protein